MQAEEQHDALKHIQAGARDVATHAVVFRDMPYHRNPFFALPSPLMVNSFHHQAVKEIAPEFVAMAFAPDGVNEAAMHSEYPIFSVQRHP